jgi:hypothetical protein
LVEYGVIDRRCDPMVACAWAWAWAWGVGDRRRLMMLSGRISVELTVEDFIAAADHQKRLEGLLAHIRDVYPDAILEMRERRERKAFALPRAPDGA